MLSAVLCILTRASYFPEYGRMESEKSLGLAHPSLGLDAEVLSSVDLVKLQLTRYRRSVPGIDTTDERVFVLQRSPTMIVGNASLLNVIVEIVRRGKMERDSAVILGNAKSCCV